MNVLVAEDDAVCRKVLETLLTKWGYSVQSACDGTEAWEILQSPNPPLLAVVDWIMPGMNGPDICRKLKSRTNSPPIYVILLTGLEGQESLVQGLDAGANDYIVKPFQKEELEARLSVGKRVVELQAASAARVEELRRQRHELARLNRALKVLTLAGQAVARATTEIALLQEICRIITDTGGYRLAWVGYNTSAGDDIHPAAVSPGTDHLIIDESSEFIVQDLFAENENDPEGDVPGDAATLSLPLVADNQVIGVLTIHSTDADSFDTEERRLLSELADELAYGIVSLRSRTERLQAEKRLLESERFARSTLDALPDQIAILDDCGRIIAVNRTWLDACHGSNSFISSGLCEGYDYLSYCDCECSGDLNGGILADGIRRVISGELPHFLLEYSCVSDDAQSWFITRVVPFLGEGERRVVVAHEDISELKRAEIEIERLAYYDPLTDLPNRVLFRDRLDQVLAHAARNDGAAALMFIDLDHFKVINDTLGHSVGDLLLKSAASRISARLRKSDTVARMGGDEFVVLMSNIKHSEDAALAARDILDSLVKPYMLGRHEVFISGSIGISLFPTDGTDGDTLLKNADIAMYCAKERGRNAYQFYTPSMNAKAEERLSLETSLRRALERDELVLHFQPWYDLRDQKITGMEALVRWQRPGQGLVPPEVFIPLAEETGIIVPIGEWVLRMACRQIRNLHDAGFADLSVSVNISSRQLKQHDLIDLLKNVVQETGIEPQWLELELTETSIMESTDDTIRTLEAIKEMGIRLSIDDFGTGYSSLSYLKRFPIDKLKIDRSFVCEVPSDEGDMAIIRAIIAFAQSMKMKVIAEGVETLDQLRFLTANCCNEAQGFFVSAAVPPEALDNLLRR